MSTWDQLASDETLQLVVTALQQNGIEAVIVENGEQAKSKVFDLIPNGAEVMTMTSTTCNTIGLTQVLDESGQYDSVKAKLKTMHRETQGREMNQLGAAPDYAVGSVHAVTEDGHILVASNSGSQIPAYVYAAKHVIWVVGTQKVVKDTSSGIQRLYEYCLPLEDARARKAYGTGSNVSKVLIINKEVKPGRLSLIFVKEKLGF